MLGGGGSRVNNVNILRMFDKKRLPVHVALLVSDFPRIMNSAVKYDSSICLGVLSLYLNSFLCSKYWQSSGESRYGCSYIGYVGTP